MVLALVRTGIINGPLEISENRWELLLLLLGAVKSEGYDCTLPTVASMSVSWFTL